MNYWPRFLALVMVSVAAVACGDGPTDPAPMEPTGTTGTLALSIEGLPAGTSASVKVAGPNGFARTVSGSQTLAGLAPGVYSATVEDVAANGLSYGTDRTVLYADVVAGASATLTVPYRAFNLSVDNFYITQSVQKYDGSIPLVAGRDGFLRVFAKANNVNTVQAPVRVRIYHGAALVETLTIPAPSFAATTEISEAALGTSWNVPISGALIKPGLSVLVDIDPQGSFAEGSEADNLFPAAGTPRAMNVQTVPKLRVMLVPIQYKDAPLGNVTEANKGRYMTDLLRMFPIADYEVQVRAPYVTGTGLQAGGGGWGSLVSELDNLRKSEGFDGYYYGVVSLPYQSGVYGIAAGIPAKTAIGNDFLDSRNLNASMTLAHEIGHAMGRFHSQCGPNMQPVAAPTDAIVEYPHPNGQIGAFGFDMEAKRLYAPDAKDLMGYCSDRWVGDHTFLKVLEHRMTREATIR